MKKEYALNLAKDGRVLSVTFDKYAPKEWSRVDRLPVGDVADYIYHADTNTFEHKPLPKPEPPESPDKPTTPEDTAAEIEKIKERINALEHQAVNN